MSDSTIFDYRLIRVTIQPKGTMTASGNSSFDAEPVQAKAWVREKRGLLKKEIGREITYDRIFYMLPDAGVLAGDRILYDDGNGERKHEVLFIDKPPDLNTGLPDHLKVYTGRSRSGER